MYVDSNEAVQLRLPYKLFTIFRLFIKSLDEPISFLFKRCRISLPCSKKIQHS